MIFLVKNIVIESLVPMPPLPLPQFPASLGVTKEEEINSCLYSVLHQPVFTSNGIYSNLWVLDTLLFIPEGYIF